MHDETSSLQSETGWELSDRPARLDDVDAIHEIAVQAGEAMGAPPLATRTEIQADLVHPILSIDLDTRVIHDAADQMLSYLVVYRERPARTFLDVYLRPGVGAELVQHLLDQQLTTGVNRVLDVAQADGLEETVAITGAQRGDDPMFTAFARHGFHLARTYWRMALELDPANPPERPELPPDVRIEYVDANKDADAARMYPIDEESFRDHYGHVATDLGTWTTELRSEAGYDRSMMCIVTVDGVDAAFLVGSDRLIDSNHGYIDRLGVLEPFRGRGLGRLLLRYAFAEYAARERVGVRLNVDSDNATGATRLYESVGMASDEVIDTWEIELAVQGM